MFVKGFLWGFVDYWDGPKWSRGVSFSWWGFLLFISNAHLRFLTKGCSRVYLPVLIFMIYLIWFHSWFKYILSCFSMFEVKFSSLICKVFLKDKSNNVLEPKVKSWLRKYFLKLFKVPMQLLYEFILGFK